MSTGIIFDLKKYAIHDGPGIRTTVFLKGCPLNCQWCHNPESIEFEPERSLNYRNPFRLNPFSENNDDLIGEEVTAEAVMGEILKDRHYYDSSGGGVTFSGGEPLAQPDFLASLLEKCNEEKLHAAVDTSGFASEETLDRVISMVDLFLFDVKLIDSELHRQYTGVENEKILNNLNHLVDSGKKVELRFPLIPDVTDTDENITQLKELIRDNPGLGKVNILPFHDVNKKYSKLGLEFPLAGAKPTVEKDLAVIVDELKSTGINVEVGG